MDFLKGLESALGGDTALGKLANSALSGLARGGDKPKPVVIQTAAAPAPMSSGLDQKQLLMIGGGVLAAVVLASVLMRK